MQEFSKETCQHPLCLNGLLVFFVGRVHRTRAAKVPIWKYLAVSLSNVSATWCQYEVWRGFLPAHFEEPDFVQVTLSLKLMRTEDAQFDLQSVCNRWASSNQLWPGMPMKDPFVNHQRF